MLILDYVVAISEVRQALVKSNHFWHVIGIPYLGTRPYA